MTRTRGGITSSKCRTTSLRAQKKGEVSGQEPEQVDEIEPPKKKASSKKREAPELVPEQFEEVEVSKKKTLKKAMTPAEKYAHFLYKSVVVGKIVKANYFKEQGLGLFLDKLQTQGWPELYTNKGCSVPDLVEFYAN